MNTIKDALSNFSENGSYKSPFEKTLNYSEFMKSQAWQKQRLEVLKRDNFTCQNCFGSENQLHVHHLKYSKNIAETPNGFLLTLCVKCHETFENSLSVIKERIANLKSSGELNTIENILSINWLQIFAAYTLVKKYNVDLYEFLQEKSK